MVVIKWKKEKLDCYILFKLGIRSIINKTNLILQRKCLQTEERLSLLIHFIQGWQNRTGHPLLETYLQISIWIHSHVSCISARRSRRFIQPDMCDFRNGTQNLTHDHWLYPRVCDKQKGWPLLFHAMPVTRCHKSFYTILLNIQTFRRLPWNL